LRDVLLRVVLLGVGLLIYYGASLAVGNNRITDNFDIVMWVATGAFVLTYVFDRFVIRRT
jgi:hypothetical protein